MMAEKRKNKKRLQAVEEPSGPYIKRCTPDKDEDIPIPVEEKPTKQDYAIATHLKKSCPTKKTKFLNHQVNYFYANKAVDILLDSQWATGKEILFTDRQSCVDYCNKLLKFKFFHRAKKIPITDKDLKPKELKKKKEKEKEEEKKKKEAEKLKPIAEKEKVVKEEKEEEEEEEKEKEEEKEEKEVKEDEETQDGKEDKDDKDKKKKKKSKIKLDMHLEQIFIDGSDAYVWMYDPIPFWYYIVGALCLCGAIAVCLYPLWPPSARKGVYYLSVAAAGFLGVILGLAVMRYIVFTIIWVLTMGHHHLWLLPNLTEDVGFFASFWPLYHYEYRGSNYEKKKKKKKKDEAQQEAEDKKSDAEIDNPDTAAETDRPDTDADRVVSEEQTAASETDSENSNSQTFEMVEKEDVDKLKMEEKESQEEDKGSGVEEIKDDKQTTINDDSS